MFISLIRVMHLKNLQVIDIKPLNLFASIGKVRIKSKVKVKKRTKRNLIGCKKL